jgi:hypothetical protein
LCVFKEEYGFATNLALEALLAPISAEREWVWARQPTKVIDEVKDFIVAHVLKWQAFRVFKEVVK